MCFFLTYLICYSSSILLFLIRSILGGELSDTLSSADLSDGLCWPLGVLMALKTVGNVVGSDCP